MLGYSAVAADSLCSGQETRVFNCAAGSKIVSVCASTTLTKSAGYLQYRFGSKTAAEVQIPAAQTHPDTSIKAGNLMFAGGGGAYLRFANGGYEYVVYTAIGKGWGTKEGVAVQKGGKPVANIKCSKLAESKLGAEFFEQAGLASDEGDFDLP
jgi:hypothetical protein